jgi:HD-like signal output (HDOD) protein
MSQELVLLLSIPRPKCKMKKLLRILRNISHQQQHHQHQPKHQLLNLSRSQILLKLKRNNQPKLPRKLTMPKKSREQKICSKL